MSATTTRATRYQELFDRYHGQITGGELAPGDRLPSFPELRAQGYGQATVEKALQMLEGEGLIQRTNGRGVFVAKAERRTNRTGLVGVMGLGDMGTIHPYWLELLTGAHNALHQNGFEAVLMKQSEVSRWDRLEGVLGFGFGCVEQARLRPAGMPIAGAMLDGGDFPYARINEAQGVEEAVAHLVSLGHRRIAYLVADAGPRDLRIAGYLAGLGKAGIKVQESWVKNLQPVASPSMNRFASAGYLTMEHWLRDDWRAMGCTALLAWNDDAASGAIRAFREAGLAVPEDVSVVGFDGSPAAWTCDPPLTTLEIPLRQMGRASAEWLLSLMKGEMLAVGPRTYNPTLHRGSSTTWIKPGLREGEQLS